MIIAIDGPSGAGKTTVAKALAAEIGAKIIHIDDYYDCSVGRLKADEVERDFGELEAQGGKIIVEGVYSLRFDFAYDLRIFLRVSEQTQLSRIKQRSPDLYDKYVDVWLPRENEYFAESKVADKCDLVLDNE